jgi:hypothetical protein
MLPEGQPREEGCFLEGEDDSGLRPPWEDSAYEEFEVSGFYKIVLLPHTGS